MSFQAPCFTFLLDKDLYADNRGNRMSLVDILRSIQLGIGGWKYLIHSYLISVTACPWLAGLVGKGTGSSALCPQV